jgi:hypothetical protein
MILASYITLAAIFFKIFALFSTFENGYYVVASWIFCTNGFIIFWYDLDLRLTFTIKVKLLEYTYVVIFLLFIYEFCLFFEKRWLIQTWLWLWMTLTVKVKYEIGIVKIVPRPICFLGVFFAAISLFDLRSKKRLSVVPTWRLLW